MNNFKNEKKHFKKNLYIFTFLIIAMLFLFGCGSSLKKIDRTKEYSDPYEELLPETFFIKSESPTYQSSKRQHSENVADEDNSYYLFLESQAQKKQGNLKEAINFLEKAIQQDPESLYLKQEMAILCLQNNDSGKALSIVEDILKIDPNHVDALIMDATIKKALNQDEDVKAIYEKALQSDPTRKGVYQILGKMYLDEGDLDNAYRIYEEMTRNFNNDYEGYYFLGRIYEIKGDPGKAEEAFLKTLELSPTLIEPRLELIKIYQASQQNQKIIAVYEKIREQYPDNIPVAVELGLQYYKNLRTVAAEEIFSELGKQSINDPNVIKVVIQSLILPQRDQDAILLLKGMLKSAPENGEIHYAAGIAYYNLGEYDAALDQFQLVQPEAKFYPNAAIHMAIVYYKKKDIDKGIEILKRAYEIIPEASKPDIIPYLVSLYKEKGLTEEAISVISDGLAIDPENTELLFELGVIYDKQGNSDSAVDQMKKVIHLNPDHADALNYLGYTYADKGINLEEAEQLIKKALVLDPNNGYIIDSLGWLYYRKKMYAEAVSYLERAVELVPDDPVILEHLGDIYIQMNQKNKAIECFQKSLLKKENDKSAIEEKIESLKKTGL